MGKLLAVIDVIEFQKRGLPHVHILMIGAISSTVIFQDVDKFVCAEIPDPAIHSTGDRDNP